MAQIQKTTFLLCIALSASAAYGAVIQNTSWEDLSEKNTTLTKNYLAMQNDDEEISEYDPQSPSLIFTEEQSQNGFQMGKSMVEALLSVFQIVSRMDFTDQNLKNVTFLVARMLSLFTGQYFETLKNLMPLFTGMTSAILKSLK